MRQRVSLVCGVDISPTAIDWPGRRATAEGIEAEFTVGSVPDLPYPDSYFDLVVDGHCFHCIVGDDGRAFLSQAPRVLRPGGLFLVLSMCNDPLDETMKKRFCPDSLNVVIGGVAGRHLGLPEDILHEAGDAGFEIIRWWVDPADTVDTQGDIIVEATKPRSWNLAPPDGIRAPLQVQLLASRRDSVA